MQEQRIHFTTIASTNTWAKENLADFHPELVSYITADEQTAGRGRFTRRWESPKQGNIYATFVFFLDPQKDFVILGNIPQVLAISATRVINQRGFSARLKWPNDITLEGCKLGGLLCETQLTDQGLGVVLGIGINVNMEQEVLDGIDQPAISLKVVNGRSWELSALRDELNEEFCKNLELCLKEGFSPFIEEFRSLAAMDTKKLLQVRDGAELFSGTFHDIDQEGALLLRLENGDLKRFLAGEILPF